VLKDSPLPPLPPKPTLIRLGLTGWRAACLESEHALGDVLDDGDLCGDWLCDGFFTILGVAGSMDSAR